MKKTMDVIDVLKHDHEVVRKLLEELSETTNRATKKREELFGKISKELKIHTQLEEEIVYPAFKKASSSSETNKMYYEAFEEHRAVE
ncbi:MAG: hemerythrin domain-containing protein, partial [Spongiibacteraceae bacterium]|nr:hemerythrin domain-containing protein [Spongiibacteraceae bacterium]